MPEFEKTQSQPDPKHNYSPSANASRKQGGRRRSGGFKTETTSSAADIGEVDPIEALKSEQLSGSKRSQETSTDEHSGDVEDVTPEKSESAKAIDDTNNTKISQSAPKTPGPQPSEATLTAIQSVEAKIARRRQEDRGKKSSLVAAERKAKPVNSNRKTDLKNGRASAPASKGGLLCAITQFFSNIFGGESKSAPKSKNSNTRSKNRRKSSGYKNHDDKRQRNDSRRGQKNYSQRRRTGKNSRSNGQRSAAK